MKTTISLLALTILVFSSCSNSSSSDSNGKATASNTEAQGMLTSVAEASKVKSYLDYVDTKSSSGNLTTEQENALNNCIKTDNSTGDSTTATSDVKVGGTLCPISYSLTGNASKSGSQIQAHLEVNYTLKSTSFANQGAVQSISCTIDINGTQGDYSNFKGTVNCQIYSKDYGLIRIGLNLNAEKTPTTSSLAITAIISALGKVANINVSVIKNSSGTTTEVYVNGVRSDDAPDFGALGEVINLN